MEVSQFRPFPRGPGSGPQPWMVAVPSLSYLYEAAEVIAGTEKPAYLYYFDDYDPLRICR